MEDGHSSKRRKTAPDEAYVLDLERPVRPLNVTSTSENLQSRLLNASISPPRKRKVPDEVSPDQALKVLHQKSKDSDRPLQTRPRLSLPSPIQLSHVEGLPQRSNVDTVHLRDILGHPLVYECWAFNYLFDVEFLLQHFDEDVRDSVALKVVHGSWKKEDSNRIRIEDAVARHQNVEAVQAYMPEAYGTHHSKAFVTFRRDDLAQITICTGNFIEQDWRMCQAVWRSPLLPLSSQPEAGDGRPKKVSARFRFDFLAYLRSYGRKLRSLIDRLEHHDFSAVKAALIGSAPGRQNVKSNPDRETRWGWLGLKDVLQHVPVAQGQPRIIVQGKSNLSLNSLTCLKNFRPLFPTHRVRLKTQCL